MTFILILITLVVATWMGFMATAVIVPFSPQVLRAAAFLVCPRSSKMVIEKGAPGERPGEYALTILCIGADGSRRDIKRNTVLAFWGLCSLVSLPLAFLVVLFLGQGGGG